MNSEGHRRLANAVLEGLGYEFDPNWKSNIPLDNGKKITIKPLSNIAWVVVFLIPWIWRRVRGKSSGDGRSAKYNEPISWLSR
jgi:hypothetical protein